MEGEAAPRKERTVVCPSHGLRYDPEVHSGCVRCRKGTPQGASARPASARDVRITAIAGGALVVVIAIVLVVRGLGSKPAPAPVAAAAVGEEIPSAAPATAGGNSKEDIVAYLQTVRRAESALPVAESREAMEGLADDARGGRLDASARLAKIRGVKQTLMSQRQALAAVPAPEAATAYRGIMLDWFNRSISMMGLGERQIGEHEDVKRLVARKAQVTTRPQAEALAAEFDLASNRVNGTLAESRRLSDEASQLTQRKRAEEDRLIREHGLTVGAEGPSPAATGLGAARQGKKQLDDLFCQSILQQGGTLADCEAAKRPDPRDFPGGR